MGIARVTAAVVIGIHGLIHAMGFVSTWGIARIEEVSAIPTSFPSAGAALVKGAGLLWLVAVVGFVVGAIGIGADRPWVRPVIAISAAISIGVCALWFRDAWIGMAVSAVILAAMLLWPRWVQRLVIG